MTDQELLDLFFSEADELILAWETGLLTLEKNPDDREVINSVFRAAHTLKGNTATIGGMDRLVDFVHSQETLLDLLRRGARRLTTPIISILLLGVDVLKECFRNVLAGRPWAHGQVVEIMERIEDRIKILETNDPMETSENQGTRPAPKMELSPGGLPSGGRSSGVRVAWSSARQALQFVLPDVASKPSRSFFLDKSRAAEIVFQDRHVFGLAIHPHRDLVERSRSWANFCRQVEQFGQILGSDSPTKSDPANKEAGHHLLIDTVVGEVDLLAKALGLGQDSIWHFPPETVQAALPETASAGVGPIHPTALSKEDSTVSIPGNPAAVSGFAGARTFEKKAPLETIRVNVHLVDRLMNLAGELVQGRNQLRRLLEGKLERAMGLSGLLQHVNQVTTDIQERTLKMRLQPLNKILNKFPRVVRDLSQMLGKNIELTINGGDVEIDKSILDNLVKPLTNLIRFSVIQGIESPSQREVLNKPRRGRLWIEAAYQESQVHIIIGDDGQGIDPEPVVAQATRRGLVDPIKIRAMTETEKLSLALLPGFRDTTALEGNEEDLGLDLVKAGIEKVGGSFQLESRVGQGTTIKLRLPLTLTIISSLFVRAGRQTFAVPQRDVQEMVSIPAGDGENRVEKVGKSLVMRLRHRLLPLVDLARVLGLSVEPEYTSSSPCSGTSEQKIKSHSPFVAEDFPQVGGRSFYVVVLRHGPHRFGLIVDDLLDMEEIVVKSLSTHLADSRIFSGATIMGDGTVALILNPSGLTEVAALNFTEIDREDRRRRKEEVTDHGKSLNPLQAVLLFTFAPDEYFALPLRNVLRLEMADWSSVRHFGPRKYLTHKGISLPLLRLDELLAVGAFPEPVQQFFVIIPRVDGPPLGILASRVIDTFDVRIGPGGDEFSRPGVKGSAIIDDRLALLLDFEQLLELFQQDPEST